MCFTKHLPISKWIIKKWKTKKRWNYPLQLNHLKTKLALFLEVKLLHDFMPEMSKWKTNPSYSTQLSTPVFLQVTTKGLSCLIWATAEIFFFSVMTFCHPNSSLPTSMLPNHPTVPQNTRPLPPHIISSYKSRTKWLMTHLSGFLCACNPTRNLSWAAEHRRNHSNEHWPWSVCTVMTSAHAWDVHTWAKHASFWGQTLPCFLVAVSISTIPHGMALHVWMHGLQTRMSVLTKHGL